uniref:Uncharacterized protein n=1 Tax=Rhizophora mucronata TaxID=61149 RepID=A0A2P2PVX9_RHIMU
MPHQLWNCWLELAILVLVWVMPPLSLSLITGFCSWSDS